MRTQITLFCGLILSSPPASGQTLEDPYQWLEEANGDRALAWVAAHNQRTLSELTARPVFDSIYRKTLEIYRARERVRTPEIRGEYGYDLLRNEEHERGLWRRTPLRSYVSGNPEWETLLDVDSLAEAEGKDWEYGGEDCLGPDYTRCLVRLSRGGRDAEEVREFDVERKTFVRGGFHLPEARNSCVWRDRNTLLVARDFGEGTTTEFGWARIVKEWKRGTPLEDAKVLFEAESPEAWAFPVVERGPDRSYVLIVQEWLKRKEYDLFAQEDGRLIKLNLPPWQSSRIHTDVGQMVLSLKSDWTVGGVTYPGETLLAIDYYSLLEGEPEVEVVLEPDEESHVLSFETSTENVLIAHVLRGSQTESLRFRWEGGRWVQEEATEEPASFLTPPPLRMVREDGTEMEVPGPKPLFDVEAFTEHRYEATSRDGTRIPYFIVHPRGMELDGHNPTILHGYGGYGTPMLPEYDPVLGTAWLGRGGAYVVAQIRGGGEFGPEWHQAALKEHRQRAFDDFIAVAEDLIAKGITSPEHLGIMGVSNGGLLVGAVLMQRPGLFGAVACLMPVLDLSKADEFPDEGAEFGNPNDPDDWAYMEKLSPYHNVSSAESYPAVLFLTSRTDDRVGPGHARKMAAKMEALGNAVYFYEPEEGGHSGRGNREQRAFREALIYTYLLGQLR
jgi:prolyl oligopeptidase